MKIMHTEDAGVLREKEYPNLAAFADAYYWQHHGKPEKMEEWLKNCSDVKQKYPKLK